jgi:hypothetical protein
MRPLQGCIDLAVAIMEHIDHFCMQTTRAASLEESMAILCATLVSPAVIWTWQSLKSVLDYRRHIEPEEGSDPGDPAPYIQGCQHSSEALATNHGIYDR